MIETLHYGDLALQFVTLLVVFHETAIFNLFGCVDFAVGDGGELVDHGKRTLTDVADYIIFAAAVPSHAMVVCCGSRAQTRCSGRRFVPLVAQRAERHLCLSQIMGRDRR